VIMSIRACAHAKMEYPAEDCESFIRGLPGAVSGLRRTAWQAVRD
jgi:hypothetical protein